MIDGSSIHHYFWLRYNNAMLVRGLLFLGLLVGLVAGYAVTPRLLDAMASTNIAAGAVFNGGWKTRFDLARGDAPFFIRAAVAQVGLGANQAEEAVYWTTSKDADGNALRGGRSYRIAISESMPDAAFWSITAYDAAHFLIDNSADMYAVTDRMYAGGATWVAFSPVAVTDTLWLPNSADDHDVTLILRMYQPAEALLRNPDSFVLPKVELQ